ncbi:MAG: helix-turn-helix transcriptional regulator [Vicinamibacterales bacterium]
MSPVVDRIVFSTECVTIGAFRCATDHPSFRNSGPIRDDCFVFPRTAVVIQHDNSRPFVADPTIVTLYNRRQHYERRAVSADGDRCDWFAVSPGLLRGALLERDPAAADEARPIRFTHAPADAATYLTQRQLFMNASAQPDADQLDIEERVVALLERVLGLAYADQRPLPSRHQTVSAVDLADSVKRWVAPRVLQRLTLTRIAKAVGCSVFHLCRSFRRATGLTLHAYRDEVRLRLALERLEHGDRDLSRIALDLGYSSHSHFTAAFRRAFGTPPSAARKLLIVRG